MASLKVAVTFASALTSAAPSGGEVELTVGAVVSVASVAKTTSTQ
jgi:hypothetical protein